MEKDNLKIAEMLDTFYPSIDGPTNVVKNYAENLNELAHCKVVVPKFPKKRKYKDEFSFEVMRTNSIWAPEGYRYATPLFDAEIVKKMDNENFDILHVHSPFTIGRLALRQGKKHKIPVVATLHTKYYDDFMRSVHIPFICRLMVKYIMQVYKKADSVWTVSDSSVQVLRDYGYKGKVVVVRNGTDLSYPDNAGELIENVNKTHNLYGQKNVFIYIGRIAMYKNLELMAKSLSILKKQGLDFKTIIVGGGFDLDKFKEVVKENDLEDRFIFTGSISDRKIIQSYYLRADLFLFPSTFDTSSLVPIEAAAHKLPVLLIKGSCTAEYITDDVNGFLSEESSEAYAKRINEIISDEKHLKEVGENASKTVYRSWRTVSEEVLEKYKEIIEEYKNSHPEKTKKSEKHTKTKIK